MTKFTKITAAIVAAAAVLSFAGCSNNTSSASESSSAVSDASTASTAEAAKTAEAASTAAATAEAAQTAEAAAPATAEASAFDASAMYGNWVLAAINDGTNTMSVADFAAANNVSAEDTLIYVNIDENSYNSMAMGVEGNYSYTVTENGITVDLDGMELPVTYDAESDILAYGVAVGDVTYKYVFMRNTDDAASTAEAAATAQAAATAEAAE
jgi:lipoprotein